MLFGGKSWSWNDTAPETGAEESNARSYSDAGIEAFRSDNWDKMSDQEKIESLQAFSDDYAAEIGLSNPPQVVTETDTRLYGGYVSNTNQLKVNLTACSNPYEAIDTVVHEDNHAYQAAAIDSALTGGSRYSAGDTAVLKAENGIAYASSGTAYDTQAIELDSNSVAVKYVSERCSGMRDDPSFYDYMSSRDGHFQKVNAVIAQDSKIVDSQEIAQVNKAYSAGELTPDEAKLASDTIAQGNIGFRQAGIAAGQAAHQGCIDGSIAKAGQLHSDYQKALKNGNLKAVNVTVNQQCIGNMEEGLEQTKAELTALKSEQSQYISSRNMGIREVAADETCKEYRTQIAACEQKMGQYNYHMTELKTDIEIASQQHSQQPEGHKDNSMPNNESRSSGKEACQSM